jgi:dTDP-4-dehydrorhamnose 3,5-epimerase
MQDAQVQVTLADFIDDEPWEEEGAAGADLPIENQIDGVRLQRLVTRGDNRGDLTVLLSELREAIVPPPHVYLVTAAPHSIRAWVYHKRQSDRLAYTNGNIRVVIYDLRPESPSYGRLNIIDTGARNKVLLTIPPLVAHGVQNRGAEACYFVNMPTRAYDPSNPDKSRLSASHPGIPYVFD